MTKYSVVQIGHMCREEIVIGSKNSGMVPGSAVYCGAIACQRLGYKTAVITKMNPKDENLIKPFKEAEVDVFIIEDKSTTTLSVVYPDESMSHRDILVHEFADYFKIEEIPEVEAGVVHIGGISTHEITTDFLRQLKGRGYKISLDSQTFLRNIEGGKIVHRDWKDKEIGLRYVDFLKVDDIETKILTGYDDLESAAKQLSDWGAKEILLTCKNGVYSYKDGEMLFERFTSSNILGRTGRGDTTISSYICKRLYCGAAESLKFCAAVVSIKMETPGPFCKTMKDVEERLKLY
jgi:sugar/nucleoside kinase (ribokinase family)